MQLIPTYYVCRDDEPVGSVLHYLEHELPGCQFEVRIDMTCALEPLADFPEIDIIEEIKNFRWYHDKIRISGIGARRVSIRRQIAHTAARARCRRCR